MHGVTKVPNPLVKPVPTELTGVRLQYRSTDTDDTGRLAGGSRFHSIVKSQISRVRPRSVVTIVG